MPLCCASVSTREWFGSGEVVVTAPVQSRFLVAEGCLGSGAGTARGVLRSGCNTQVGWLHSSG